MAQGAMRSAHVTSMHSSFVVSLDFELFWGVSNSRTVASYRKNVEGVWHAVPRMLALFRQHGVRATWAAVGMLMCRDHAQWKDIRPAVLPGYVRQRCSTYSLGPIAREYPKLFFARALVEQILATPGQELATHTYSHFYCGEDGATPEQFTADLACAREIASLIGVRCSSLVFPRNQIRKEFVGVLAKAELEVYRGNPDHCLYRAGRFPPGGMAGRAARFVDSWVPMTDVHTAHAEAGHGVVNVPASLFLRPWPRRLAALESVRLARVKQAMTTAARAGGIFHLWWHPHNCGVNIDQNLAVLKSLLQHYHILRDQYGMCSLSMVEAAELA